MTLTLTTESADGRTTEKQLSTAATIGCLVLFLLPFAAAGTFTAVRAVRLLQLGNWREAGLFAIFALVFGGVGYGGLAGARIAYRKLKDEEALRAAHPGEPWLWRKDWASGRIPDSTQDTMLGAWIFAALWNLISLPSAYLGVRAAIQESKPAAFVVLLFPLAGIWLLVRALQATARKRKYGISLLELSTVPGVIGHALTGNVRAGIGLQPAEGFLVTLTCIRKVSSRSGKNSSTTETILWQEERRAQGIQSRDYTGMGTNIPVKFRIPADAQASDNSNSNNRVIWQLGIAANVPGVDYDSTFEVPVFRTAASEQPQGENETQLEEDRQQAVAYHQPTTSRITVTTNRRGTEILFPVARNPGPAANLTVFTLIWWGTIAAQVYFKAPLIFPIVTALFGSLLVVGVLELWLRVYRVSVDAGVLTVASGYLHPGRERKLTAAEVADIAPAIGMQVGKTPYYDVEIRRKDGKKVTAGRSVRDKREAEWLAATIKQALKV